MSPFGPAAPLLITGFEPFGGWQSNPTQIIAPAVADALGLPHLVLPVDLIDAPRALARACVQHRPMFTLHLGLSGRATSIQLERVAINVADFRIADAAGRQPRADRLVEDAPDGLLSRVDLHALRDACPQAEISNTAGTYLCNALYFHALLRSQGRSLFVHVPPTPGMQAAAASTEHGAPAAPGMPIEQQIQAVEAIARYLLGSLETAA